MEFKNQWISKNRSLTFSHSKVIKLDCENKHLRLNNSLSPQKSVKPAYYVGLLLIRADEISWNGLEWSSSRLSTSFYCAVAILSLI